jgi:hypothetical protein
MIVRPQDHLMSLRPRVNALYARQSRNWPAIAGAGLAGLTTGFFFKRVGKLTARRG